MSRKIEDRGGFFTAHTQVGNIGDSFFYQTYWYYDNHLLITTVRGEPAAKNEGWVKYLGERGIKHEVMGDYVVILPESVEQLFMDEGTFTGGSAEVYVSRRKPGPDNLPKRTYLPPDVKFDEDLPEEFLDTFNDMVALVFMSGGEGGINIAHKVKEEIISFVMDTM